MCQQRTLPGPPLFFRVSPPDTVAAGWGYATAFQKKTHIIFTFICNFHFITEKFYIRSHFIIFLFNFILTEKNTRPPTPPLSALVPLSPHSLQKMQFKFKTNKKRKVTISNVTLSPLGSEKAELRRHIERIVKVKCVGGMVIQGVFLLHHRRQPERFLCGLRVGGKITTYFRDIKLSYSGFFIVK